MHCHCGTNNRAPQLTFTDPCKPEVRPGAREESPSPVWLAAPAVNARDTTKGMYGGLTLDVDRHNIGSVTATTYQEKGIITLESNSSRGTVLPAPQGKGNKCDKNVKYKRTDALSLWHQQKSTTVDIHGPLQTRGENRCPGGVSVSCLASRTRHDCPRHNKGYKSKCLNFSPKSSSGMQSNTAIVNLFCN